jgi:hypothetical protein
MPIGHPEVGHVIPLFSDSETLQTSKKLFLTIQTKAWCHPKYQHYEVTRQSAPSSTGLPKPDCGFASFLFEWCLECVFAIAASDLNQVFYIFQFQGDAGELGADLSDSE